MLEPAVRQMCTEGRNYACLTTMSPGDIPHATVVWVDADDHHVLVNTELGRRQARNAMRDPRVVALIWDLADPERCVEVRGRVTAIIQGSAARSHIDKLSEKYEGKPYEGVIRTERMIIEITPDHQVIRG